MKEELIVLCGPTASGKSAVALALCELLGAELVSCDSMQLYRGMDIGTAKPTADERSRVPHHLIDALQPDENCSAARYRELALPIIRSLFEVGKQPVLCGGTGLYIDALTKPLGFSVEGDPAIRASFEREAERPEGKQRLHARLREIDPDSAERLHENDVRRVIRALEVHALTGVTLTEQMARDAVRVGDYPAWLYALDWPRDVLYARIDARVDAMIEQGLIGEVENLLQTGLSRDGTAMQAIGYKEIAAALSGEISMKHAVDQIKQATRNYAKRQLTWFRRDKRVTWIPAEGCSADEIARTIFEEVTR